MCGTSLHKLGNLTKFCHIHHICQNHETHQHGWLLCVWPICLSLTIWQNFAKLSNLSTWPASMFQLVIWHYFVTVAKSAKITFSSEEAPVTLEWRNTVIRSTGSSCHSPPPFFPIFVFLPVSNFSLLFYERVFGRRKPKSSTLLQDFIKSAKFAIACFSGQLISAVRSAKKFSDKCRKKSKLRWFVFLLLLHLEGLSVIRKFFGQ